MSDIEKAIEDCKTEMYDIFKKHHTYYFWKEEDIQSYLYSLMLQSGKFVHRLSEDKTTLLIHREYTTKSQYDTSNNYRIFKKKGNSSRGEIDIVVWNPSNEWKEYNAEYKIHSAIELKFQRDFVTGRTKTSKSNFLEYFYPDYRKVTDIENGIEFGHMMYFVKSNRRKPLFNNIGDVKKVIKDNVRNLPLEREVNLDKVKFTYMEISAKMREPIFLKNYDNNKKDDNT
jgi:hypothetical protein